MGTGKQSALKQSSDGSFELVVSDDAEVEAEAAAPAKTTRSGREPDQKPGGVVKWAVLAAVLLGIGAVVALVVSGSEDSSQADADTPAGFKPYVGDVEQAESAIVPVDPVRPSKPARRAVPDDPEPEEEVEVVDEMAEVDDAWQVEESGEEIVESEDVPPDFIDQVVETEGDDEAVEIEPARDGTRFVDPKALKNIRQRIQKDVEIRKTLPNLNIETAPRVRPTRISPGNDPGPADPDDITVIEEEELEEIPEE